MKSLTSAVFLLAPSLALGAFGHSFMGRLPVDAELDKFPVARDVYSMLYVTGYFVGGCMLVFGMTIVVAWFRLRRGDSTLLLITLFIGMLYLAVGIGGMVYRHGDPFVSVFIVERSSQPARLALKVMKAGRRAWGSDTYPLSLRPAPPAEEEDPARLGNTRLAKGRGWTPHSEATPLTC